MQYWQKTFHSGTEGSSGFKLLDVYGE